MSRHFHGQAHFKGGFDLPYQPPKHPCTQCGKFEREQNSEICWVCSETKKSQEMIANWKKEQANLTHIDSLVGDERLTISQMIDATELPFDFTPCESMPQIDFNNIDEIPF